MKKGFTLIEIIAVICVVAILTLLIMPNILNLVNNKRDEVSSAAKEMIYDATDLYIKENSSLYPINTSGVYCIKIETLVNDGKLVEPVKDLTTDKEIPLNYYVKVTIDSYNQYQYTLVNKCETSNS